SLEPHQAMAKNKNLANKRAKKAEKRRERKLPARAGTGPITRAAHAKTQAMSPAFPPPEKFAIEPTSIFELQRKVIDAGPLSVLSLLSLEILFGGDEPGRIWLSVEHPTWLALVSRDAWVQGFANPIEYGEINKLINEHVDKTHGRLMSLRIHAAGA